jgi:hypothetical protein
VASVWKCSSWPLTKHQLGGLACLISATCIQVTSITTTRLFNGTKGSARPKPCTLLFSSCYYVLYTSLHEDLVFVQASIQEYALVLRSDIWWTCIV